MFILFNRGRRMKLSKSVRPISYLKAHASEILNHLDEDKETLIITQNGEAKAALMESMAMLKLVSQSRKSIEEKKVRPFREVFKNVREELENQVL